MAASNYNPEVNLYIKQQPAWQQEVASTLRRIIHEADPDITEVIKWNTPYFEHQGAVCWLFCAVDWVHFSFRQGKLLDSSHGLFEPTDNQAQRTIKFRKGQVILEDIIEQLVRQAVHNNIVHKKVKFSLPKPGQQTYKLPKKYETILRKHKVYTPYKQRPYYQQKGYVQWIEAAKRPVTQTKRIDTMVLELQHGQYMPTKAKR